MKDKKMPIFGIGPMYVITTLLLTIFGLGLDNLDLIAIGKIKYFKNIFIAFGVFLLIFGIFIWIYAVIFQKINIEISKGNLITTGIYKYVRNPVYSAFTFVFTGVLFTRYNFILLILPVIFYVFLTILLINTEEKWLEEKFGEDYIKYKNEVNRIIPSFSYKNSR